MLQVSDVMLCAVLCGAVLCCAALFCAVLLCAVGPRHQRQSTADHPVAWDAPGCSAVKWRWHHGPYARIVALPHGTCKRLPGSS